jgi:molybdate transport system ATP-binding protein
MTLVVRFRHAFPGLRMEIDFSAPTPGTTVLFGRSGAGKSTVIAAVAGLIRPAAAHIEVQDVALTDTSRNYYLPSERRRIGLVFQDSRLFPHMTVASNLRYGLHRALAGRIAFDDVVDLLGLGPLLARRPRRLSGGEKSRVAIGRALLSQPRLLALDEPLASLDAQHKAEILPYLARLKQTLSLPILYVTHSLDEVARLADTLVLIRAGRVLASGPMMQILARGDLPMAGRDEAAAVLEAEVISHDTERQLTELKAAGRRILVPLQMVSVGNVLRIRVPAREVILATAEPRGISVHNVIPGTVGRIVQDVSRHAALVEVSLDGRGLLARVTPDAVARLGLQPGVPVLALVKSMAIEVLSDESRPI